MQAESAKFETDSHIHQIWVGIDPGVERTGLATSGISSSLATPHSVLPTVPRETLVSRLLKQLTPLVPVGFAIGLALDPKGNEGVAAGLARELGERLAAELHLPVEFVDERFTTKDAYARRKEAGFKSKKIRKDLDAYAAAAILQAWLDRRGQGSTSGMLN